MALLVGCGSPVEPVPEPPSGPTTVQLGPVVTDPEPTACLTGMEGRHLTGEGFVAHPDIVPECSYLPAKVGTRTWSVAFCGDAVSVDVDANGSIDDGEQTSLKDGKASFEMDLDGSPHRLHLGRNEAGKLCHGNPVSRSADVPGLGQLHLLADHGSFTSSGARVVLGRNGEPDRGNLVANWRVGTGQLQVADRVYAFSVARGGSALELAPSDAEPAALAVGRAAPAFEVPTVDGDERTMASFAGKPLILDFWGTWCAPCIQEHPRLQRLADKHDTQVMGIAVNDTVPKVTAHLAKHPLPWPNAAVEPSAALVGDYLVRGYPTYVLVDAEGRLQTVGGIDALERALEASL